MDQPIEEMKAAKKFQMAALENEKARFAQLGRLASSSDEMLAILLCLKGDSEDREAGFTRLEELMKQESWSSPLQEDAYFAVRAIPPVSGLLQGNSLRLDQNTVGKLTTYLRRLHACLVESAETEADSISRFLKIRLALAIAIAQDQLGEEPSRGGLPPPLLSLDDFFHPQLSQDLFTLLFMREKVRERFVGRDTLRLLRCLWSEQEGVFFGPPLCSFHERSLPSVQPGDFWMSCLSGVLPERLMLKEPPLESALYPAAAIPFSVGESSLGLMPSDADSLFAQGLSLFAYPTSDIRLKPYWRAFHLVRGVIAGAGRLLSFSVQGKAEAEASILKSAGAIEVRFSYLEEQRGETDPAGLIGFYIDRRSGVQYTVNDSQSTVFNLGDTLAFKGEFGEIRVVFSKIAGDATVLGHISPGGRPALEESDGGDWVAYLRPVKLETAADFLMTIHLDLKRA